MENRPSSQVSLTVAAVMSLSLLGMPAVAFAGGESGGTAKAGVSKTQVVYTKTDPSGSSEGVYVVNMFENKGKASKTVRDAGSYQSVKNLSDDQSLSSSGKSAFKVSADSPFLYQGDMSSSANLPWKISVKYKLDGKEVDPSHLAGASGSLEMHLKVSPNKKCAGDYANNYLLQVTGLFDNKQVSSLVAKDSTKAQSGDSTQVGYMVFPGKSASHTVKAEVSDFEFDGWTIVGVPLSLALDLDESDFSDGTASLDSLESAVGKINDGASSLASGAEGLAQGASSASESADSLASGTGRLSAGASNLSSNAASLSDGAASLSEGAEALSAGAGTLSEKLESLDAASEKLERGSDSYLKGLSSRSKELAAKGESIDVESAQKEYEKATEKYVAAFSGSFAQAYAQSGSKEQAQAAAEKASSSEKSAMESKLKALIKAQAEKTGNSSASKALDEAAKGYSQIDSGVASLSDASSKVAKAGDSLSDAAKELDKGSSALSDGTSQLSSGADSLSSSSDKVSTGANSLASGVDSLDSGASSLAEGAASLSDGTSKVKESTTGLSKKMIDKVRDKLEERLDPDYDPVDFVDSGNEVESVQFVVKTGEIETPKEEESVLDEAGQQETFWQKLLALFGL